MEAYIKQSTTFEGYHLDCGHDVVIIKKGAKTSKIQAETFGKVLTGKIDNSYLRLG